MQPRASARIALVIAASAAMAGCTLVGDTVTGVRLDRAAPVTCLQQCTTLYKEGLELERLRYAEAIEACQALSEGTGPCIAAEAREHQEAIADLLEARNGCRNSCHRQGNGSAG